MTRSGSRAFPLPRARGTGPRPRHPWRRPGPGRGQRGASARSDRTPDLGRGTGPRIAVRATRTPVPTQSNRSVGGAPRGDRCAPARAGDAQAGRRAAAVRVGGRQAGELLAPGRLVALYVTNQYISVPSVIGFITVFGVAMLNGIVLVSFINDLRSTGANLPDAVRLGCRLRVTPVLMTASTSILGLLPMLLSTGVGAETQRPLATVVVGGLFTSTILTLILLPAVYEWVESNSTEPIQQKG